jgi:hypothetical protein
MVQAFKSGGEDTQTHRQQDDLIRLLSFFKNEKSRIKIK